MTKVVAKRPEAAKDTVSMPHFGTVRRVMLETEQEKMGVAAFCKTVGQLEGSTDSGQPEVLVLGLMEPFVGQRPSVNSLALLHLCSSCSVRSFRAVCHAGLQDQAQVVVLYLVRSLAWLSCCSHLPSSSAFNALMYEYCLQAPLDATCSIVVWTRMLFRQHVAAALTSCL